MAQSAFEYAEPSATYTSMTMEKYIRGEGEVAIGVRTLLFMPPSNDKYLHRMSNWYSSKRVQSMPRWGRVNSRRRLRAEAYCTEACPRAPHARPHANPLCKYWNHCGDLCELC
ncbi:jg9621 [Pararge aegeria aegeria]|uniref:Jg9621 protein n=1 Tax=Pararge aegeria aegeria TaxID=348720 RepID=A0A8S4RUP5_9NEOP|nr:jg9621 [Pararge aegeria aegeria]